MNWTSFLLGSIIGGLAGLITGVIGMLRWGFRLNQKQTEARKVDSIDEALKLRKN